MHVSHISVQRGSNMVSSESREWRLLHGSIDMYSSAAPCQVNWCEFCKWLQNIDVYEDVICIHAHTCRSTIEAQSQAMQRDINSAGLRP